MRSRTSVNIFSVSCTHLPPLTPVYKVTLTYFREEVWAVDLAQGPWAELPSSRTDYDPTWSPNKRSSQ